MLPDLIPIEWVSAGSLSLSLSALLARFLTKEDKVSARAHLLSAVVVLALVSAGLGTAYSVRRGNEVSKLATDIYVALGNQQKTSDQLLVELGPQSELQFNAAIAHLKSQKKLDSSVEHVSISGGQPNAVRVWRALAP